MPGYAEIGHEVARQGFDSVSRRAVVSPARKLRLIAQTARPTRRRADLLALPPQDETRFLVDAVAPAPPPAGRRYGEQVLWALELFDRVEARRAGRGLGEGAL